MDVIKKQKKSKKSMEAEHIQERFDSRSRLEEDFQSTDFMALQRLVGNRALVNFVKGKLSKGNEKAPNYKIDQNYNSKLLTKDQARLILKEKNEGRLTDSTKNVTQRLVKKSPRINERKKLQNIQATSKTKVKERKLPGLPDILYDPYFGEAFQSFANKNSGANEIDCYKRIDKYSKKPSNSFAIFIYDQYIKNGKIKISGATKRDITSKIKEIRKSKEKKSKIKIIIEKITSLFGFSKKRKPSNHPELFLHVTQNLQITLNNLYNKFISSKECKAALLKANALSNVLDKNDLL